MIHTFHDQTTPATSPTGILLANTGSPDAPTPRAVRRFLAEFLADRRVIEAPRWAWLPILHGFILNTRPRRSANLYRKIWQPDGSPLLRIAQKQASALREEIGKEHIKVVIGMRYGNPSITSALRELQRAGVQRILVFPLFPQYSGATTGSIFDAVFEELKLWRWLPELHTISAYYDHPAYIHALVSSIQHYQQEHGKAERILFSYHGIPENYARAGDPYHEQCLQTSSLVAEALALADGSWQTAFQSRFGPQEWLRPYTGQILEDWGERGVKSVQVVAPGFSADCLETLYEIDIEAKEDFVRAGGDKLAYIPALNAHPAHITALAEIVQMHILSGDNSRRYPLNSYIEAVRQ